MNSLIGKSKARSRGFTLVEALIALVVLSIGLLGVASLQLSSLRWNHGASMRSQATLLAYDVLDRMRANQVAANAGEYDIAIGATPTGTTVAAQDLIGWRTNLSSTLPGGTGAVSRNVVGSNTTYTIEVRWNDSHSEGTPTTMSFMLRTEI
jgi:type IV pilus assembly protein PilV